MLQLIFKFLNPSPGPHSYLKLPVCEPDLILKKLSYDELRLIFDFLSLKELVKCRRVCKTFRSVVDSIRIKELLVFENWMTSANADWFQSDKLVHSKNSVTVRYVSWALRSFQRIGHNLKFLSLKCAMSSLRLEDLNSFVQLEELWILEVDHLSYVPKATLKLPNLKKIAFSLSYSGYGLRLPWVALDTPSLEDVRVERNLQWVQFNFGATVKRLRIGKCKPTYELLNQFKGLKNLERFSCTHPAFLDAFNILKLKPGLKRIDCHRHESGKQFDIIERLLIQKAESSHPVEIYFEGQLVKDMSDLDKLILQNRA